MKVATAPVQSHLHKIPRYRLLQEQNMSQNIVGLKAEANNDRMRLIADSTQYLTDKRMAKYWMTVLNEDLFL